MGRSVGSESTPAEQQLSIEPQAKECREVFHTEGMLEIKVDMEDLRQLPEPASPISARSGKGLPTVSFAAAKRSFEQDQRVVKSRDFRSNAPAVACGVSFASKMRQAQNNTSARMWECKAAGAAAATRTQESVSLEHIRRSVDVARAESIYVKTSSPRKPLFCDDIAS